MLQYQRRTPDVTNKGFLKYLSSDDNHPAIKHLLNEICTQGNAEVVAILLKKGQAAWNKGFFCDLGLNLHYQEDAAPRILEDICFPPTLNTH